MLRDVALLLAWRMLPDAERSPPPPPPPPALLVADMGPLPVEDAVAGPDLLAMAEVERRFVGRRPLLVLPSLLPAEELGLVCSGDSGASKLAADAPFGLGAALNEDEEGPRVLRLTGGLVDVDVWGVAVAAAVGGAVDTADWDRCRMEMRSERSDGLRLRSWLFDARWPGV